MRNSAPQEPTRRFSHPERLLDDPLLNTQALGCRGCPDEGVCGRVHTEAGIFDCRDFCSCADPALCDMVCRRKPLAFYHRYQEVRGFGLGNVPRSTELPVPELPDTIPFVGDKHSRIGPLNEPFVALPLYRVVRLRDGRLHVADREELASRFRVPADAKVVLTGVDRDYRLEGWWSLSDRKTTYGALRDLGINLITSPNFSLFTDVPRPDNLHAIKRIAIAWEEINSAGIASALHLNARTYFDYQRWLEFIIERPEVTMVSFEFGTGAGRGTRLDWHVDRLCELADRAGRPLVLVVRGGWRALSRLRRHFFKVVLIETEAFSRAVHRRQATINERGKLGWKSIRTAKGTPVDHLFAHNVSIVRLALTLGIQDQWRSIERKARSNRTTDTDNEARQGSFLPQFNGSSQTGAVASDGQNVIHATEA